MKKKLFISGVICLLMLFCSTNVFAGDLSISSQNGTQVLTTEQENRIQSGTTSISSAVEASSAEVTISNASELKAFRDRVNNGETALNAELTTDIDLQGENWTPIGLNQGYSGTFHGNGYMISGLNVTYSAAGAGLFSFTNGALISDLGVDGTVSSSKTSGGIVAGAYNTYIIDCYNCCDVTGSYYAGGIAGITFAVTGDSSKSSAIIGCYNTGDIYAYDSNNTASCAGGISGYNEGTVTIANCYNWGTISDPDSYGGGIAGFIGTSVLIACTYNMGEPDNVLGFGEIAGLAAFDAVVANSYFLNTGYHGIRTDNSTGQHTIYYSDDYYDMTTQDFVDHLNNGSDEQYFVFDKYYINYGLPALKWEQPYSFFDDVSTNDWFIAPVNWAVSNDVTYGTSDTQFSPNSVCTRAQTVTFLWRAAGSPNPTSGANPFTDVKSGSYYYNAVLWAVENHITAGTSATTFSPDDTVSRAQVVTFLWRMDGYTSVSGANPFTDVTANAYYNNAVLWAVGNGITYGTSTTTFSPDSGCTRAQIVSFLYRYFVL